MKFKIWDMLRSLRKPKTFFSSDFHFSHFNVIGYCSRPWPTLERMNEALVSIWNKQVAPQDTVYFLGDFSMNSNAMKKFAPRLNGKKILIPGNHDSVFTGRRVKPQEKQKYIDAGWIICEPMEVTLKNGYQVLLSHFPYATEESLKYDTRYQDFRPINKGLFLLHGHLHSKFLKNKNMIDVGIDNNFKLLSEDDIIKLIDDPRDFIPSRLTGRKPSER